MMSFDNVTLTDMDVKLPEEYWTVDSPDDYKVICLRAIQEQFRLIVARFSPDDKQNRLMMQRALDTAKVLALHRLPKLRDKHEAAFIWLVDEANRTDWHLKDYFDYKDIGALLADSLDSVETGTSAYYDYKFLHEILLPFAESVQVPVDQLLLSSMRIGKLRKCVPVARTILNDKLLDDEKKGEYLKELIQDVASSNITVDAFTDKANEVMGTSHGYEMSQAKVFLLPGNRMQIRIDCTPGAKAAIESALDKLCQFHIGDIKESIVDDIGLIKDSNFQFLLEQVLALLQVKKEVDELPLDETPVAEAMMHMLNQEA